jgi:hypothetical protein
MAEKKMEQLAESLRDVQVFSREVLPAGNYRIYRKRVFTHAVRVIGPFTVQTREGQLFCADGYLAIDSAGYPYPIAAEEFERVYELAEPAPEE